MRNAVVLIADNDRKYRLSLAALLRDIGLDIRLAGSVEAANRLLETEAIDVALADLRMTSDDWETDFSGLDVAEKALQENVPCIAITAFGSVEATRRALHRVGRQPPVVDFVPKTRDPTELLQRIRVVLAAQPFPILHISDLHFGQPDDSVDLAQDLSLFAFQQDLRKLKERRQVGRIRALVVSGDFVLRGDTRGYVSALRFLRRIAKELKLEPEDCVLVPGNHDVERGAPNSLKLNSFLDFSTEFYGARFYNHDKLYRVFDFGRVSIVALSSCHRDGIPDYLLRVGSDEYYPGWIDPTQLKTAVEELPRRRGVLHLAVCHHHVVPENEVGTVSGVSHLVNYHDTVKPWLAQAGVRALLHGHGHRARLLQPAMAGSRMPLAFGSGTLLLGRDSADIDRTQYLIMNLGPESQVIMRRYLCVEQDGSFEWGVDQTASGEGTVDLPGISLPRSIDG